MRKFILILAILAIVPTMIFAEFGVGAAAFYKAPFLLGQPIDLANLNVDQFSFGADARFKLGWFQAEGLVLYATGDVNSLNAYLDLGIALDVAILRLSLGAGPNFTYNFGDSSPFQAGLNAKVGADIMLGPVSIGASYIMAMNLLSGVHINTSSGLLGIQILFWL